MRVILPSPEFSLSRLRAARDLPPPAFATMPSLVCFAQGEEAKAETGGGSGNIQGGTCTLAELLAGDIRLELPFYQREYTWKPKHCDELWEDILGVRNRSGKSHYMGSVTLESIPNIPGGYRIIDGQQRLVSLCLMAGACIRKLRGPANTPAGDEDQARADKIARMFLVNGDDPRNSADMKVRMLNLDGHNDHDYFRELTLGDAVPADPNNPVQENLRAAYKKFRTHFGSLESGEACFKFMRVHAGTGLRFTRTALGSEFDGHRVYATLNFRGFQLTAAHVIKAHLLAEVSAGELDLCSQKWADLLKKVGEKNMIEFLRHAFNSQHRYGGRPVGDAELPNAVKSVVSESDESKTKVIPYLSDLHKKADFFVKLRDGAPNDWPDKDLPSVRSLKPYKAMTPMLMSAYERFSRNDFSRILCMCEVVMLRRSAVGLQARPMADFACDSAVKIQAGEIGNYAELRRQFIGDNLVYSLLPSNEAFGGGILANFPEASAPKLHYLARMEQSLSEDGGYPHILPAHVMPLLSKDDLRNLGLPANLEDNVANLVLWDRGIRISAQPYEQRVEALRTSRYRLSQETAEQWPELIRDLLKERGDWMKGIIVKTLDLDKCGE